MTKFIVKNNFFIQFIFTSTIITQPNHQTLIPFLGLEGYNAMLRALLRSDDSAAAQQLMSEMRDAGIPAHISTYNILIESFISKVVYTNTHTHNIKIF